MVVPLPIDHVGAGRCVVCLVISMHTCVLCLLYLYIHTYIYAKNSKLASTAIIYVYISIDQHCLRRNHGVFRYTT